MSKREIEDFIIWPLLKYRDSKSTCQSLSLWWHLGHSICYLLDILMEVLLCPASTSHKLQQLSESFYSKG